MRTLFVSTFLFFFWSAFLNKKNQNKEKAKGNFFVNILVKKRLINHQQPHYNSTKMQNDKGELVCIHRV